MGKKALVALAVAVAAVAAVLVLAHRQSQPLRKPLNGIVKALPGVERWSFKHAELDASGTLKISQVQVKLAGRPDPLTIERLEITGFNAENLAKVAGLRNWQGQPEIPLTGRFVCDDLVIPTKTRAGVKIAKLEGEALKLAEAGAGNPEGLAGFLVSLKAGRLMISHLESPARPQSEPVGRLLIQAIQTKQITGGQIGRYQMTGLEISSPPPSPEALGNQLKIGQVEISQLGNLLGTDFFKKIIGGQKPDYDPGLQFLLSPTFGLEEALARDVIYLAEGKPALTWAEFKLSGPITPGQMPPLVTASAKNIVIPVTAASPLSAAGGNPFAQLGLALHGLGYQSLAIAGFEQERAYNAQAETYRESYNHLDIKDAFKLDFFFEFAEFDPRKILEAAPRSSADPFVVFADVPLHEAHLKLIDDSLAERVLKFIAIYRGQTIEGTKQALIEDLRAQAGPAFKKLAGGDRLLRELSAFIKEPKSVEISLTPSAPVTMADLGRPGFFSAPETLNQLNLVVVFNGNRAIAIKAPAAK